MFYGAAITPGKTVSPSPDQGEILHLSQVALKDPKAEGRTVVEIENNGSKFVLCSLQKDKIEQVSVDLFVPSFEGNVFKFSTSGAKNEVHILGYYEPQADDSESCGDSEDMMGSLMGSSQAEEASNDEELDSDEVEPVVVPEPKAKAAQVKAIAAKGKPAAAAAAAAPAKVAPKKIEVSEGSSDEDVDDIAESTDASPEATGASENESEESEEEVVVAKPAPAPKAANKRKQPETPASPAPKKAKVDAPVSPKAETKPAAAAVEAKPAAAAADAKASSAGDQQFITALVGYLKKNGRTALGTLGSKVKKPESVSQKLGVFIKAKSDVFKVENGNVSLVKP